MVDSGDNVECGAYYGVGDGTAAICKRPVGHPPVSEDGIGHSPLPIRVPHSGRSTDE